MSAPNLYSVTRSQEFLERSLRWRNLPRMWPVGKHVYCRLLSSQGCIGRPASFCWRFHRNFGRNPSGSRLVENNFRVDTWCEPTTMLSLLQLRPMDFDKRCSHVQWSQQPLHDIWAIWGFKNESHLVNIYFHFEIYVISDTNKFLLLSVCPGKKRRCITAGAKDCDSGWVHWLAWLHTSLHCVRVRPGASLVFFEIPMVTSHFQSCILKMQCVLKKKCMDDLAKA